MSFFQKPLTPPLTFGIFEALFSLFPKLFNKNFKKKKLTVLSLLAHWHLFAKQKVPPPPPLEKKTHI